MTLSEDADDALLQLLKLLEGQGYDFVTPTPATHARVIARRGKARTFRDVFGWSLPFDTDILPASLLDLLLKGEVLGNGEGAFKSKIRVSRVAGHLFVHSAYPTEAEDSVFLGPDSYRFADFIRAELPRAGAVRRLVDIGAGAGVGAITAAPLVPGARITLLDINPLALRLAAVNARHAGLSPEAVEGEGIEDVSGPIDLAIANPPYIMDEEDRAYRDGGGMHGGRISLEWALATARRLEPGGRMLLYTGVSIVEGRDELREALEHALPASGCSLRYRELDPDVFGEELEQPCYTDVERIAVIGAVIEKGVTP